MKITSLECSNYRCFKNLKLDFDRQMTVLVGRNCAGKTAILDLLTIAVGPYLTAFATSTGAGFSSSDAKLEYIDPNDFAEERLFPVSLGAIFEIDGETVETSRSLGGEKSRTTTAEAAALSQYGQRLKKSLTNGGGGNRSSLPVLCYYGTGRIWKKSRLTEKKEQSLLSETRQAGYRDCMNPSSNFKDFCLWYKQLFIAFIQKRIEASSTDAPMDAKAKALQDFILAIQSSVDAVLSHSEWGRLMYDASIDQVVVSDTKRVTIPVSEQSDGVKSVIAMASDLAFRCCKLNPHLGKEAPAKTTGIVLIDELDLHLHPAWQQEIARAMTDAFPSVQFIVTTHSPHLVSTVRSESIRILHDSSVHSSPMGIQGADAGRVLKRVFGVDPRYWKSDVAVKLNRYQQLVFEGHWDSQEAKTLRAELDAAFGNEEPELLNLDLYIENRLWEMEDEKDRKES